jgi:hypothetical protein
MARLTRVITFSNVISCVALFAALGGSVYAAGKLDGRQIKAKSIPGNRLKPKTVTAKQVKPRSLTGAQIKSGSLTGTQIKAGSLTGAQVVGSTLTGVTASSVASIHYAVTTVALSGMLGGGDTGTAICPPGTKVTGGGAAVSNDEVAFVNDSSPTPGRDGWTATGAGEAGSSMTITAICTAAAGATG